MNGLLMKVFKNVRPVLILSCFVILALIVYSLGKLYEFEQSDFYKKYFTKKVFSKSKTNELHYQREEGNPLR